MLVELIISICRFDGLARLNWPRQHPSLSPEVIKIVSCHCIITVLPRTWALQERMLHFYIRALSLQADISDMNSFLSVGLLSAFFSPSNPQL
jgi:hypothetical protein